MTTAELANARQNSLKSSQAVRNADARFRTIESQNGELRVKFRQPFDLIALGTTELKQKKAAGVGSDDLYQLKYTPLDSNQ